MKVLVFPFIELRKKLNTRYNMSLLSWNQVHQKFLPCYLWKKKIEWIKFIHFSIFTTGVLLTQPENIELVKLNMCTFLKVSGIRYSFFILPWWKIMNTLHNFRLTFCGVGSKNKHPQTTFFILFVNLFIQFF